MPVDKEVSHCVSHGICCNLSELNFYKYCLVILYASIFWQLYLPLIITYQLMLASWMLISLSNNVDPVHHTVSSLLHFVIKLLTEKFEKLKLVEACSCFWKGSSLLFVSSFQLQILYMLPSCKYQPCEYKKLHIFCICSIIT